MAYLRIHCYLWRLTFVTMVTSDGLCILRTSARRNECLSEKCLTCSFPREITCAHLRYICIWQPDILKKHCLRPTIQERMKEVHKRNKKSQNNLNEKHKYRLYENTHSLFVCTEKTHLALCDIFLWNQEKKRPPRLVYTKRKLDKESRNCHFFFLWGG